MRKDQTGAADYLEILTEIESIGWDKLESINSTFTELKLKMCDSADRQHILTIKLGGNTPEFIAEFPRPFLSQVCYLVDTIFCGIEIVTKELFY